MDTEYKLQPEPKYDKKYRQDLWDLSSGMQNVDNLKVSDYAQEQAQRYIEGEYSSSELKERLDTNAQTESANQREADMVAARMVELLETMNYSHSPAMLKVIHSRLFDGVLPVEQVGEFRKHNLTKSERVLGGESVVYADWSSLNDYLKYDFDEELNKKYEYPLSTKDLHSFAQFISSVWQVHPFYEGNTRAVTALMQLYLRHLGLPVNNEPFYSNAKYFRDALVVSNYSNIPKGVYSDFSYLEDFLAAVLFNQNKNEFNEIPVLM